MADSRENSRVKPLLRLLVASVVASATGARGNVIYDVPQGITVPDALDIRWNATGQWGVGGGVVIAPHSILSAQHIGTPDSFYLSSTKALYRPVSPNSYTDIPNTDLRIWKMNATFPTSLIVPLYSGGAGSEAGQAVSFVGFGHFQQGDPIVTNGLQNGWLWGASTGKNAGANTVDAISQVGPNNQIQFPALDYAFKPIIGRSQSIYSVGDSGGGAFIFNNGQWQLAGVAYGITEFFTRPDPASAINAAIYDATGLYAQDDQMNFRLASDLGVRSQHGYASQIAPYVGRIDSQVFPPGDANMDGKVDFSDFNILAANFGKHNATFQMGDFDGDGIVDLSDFTLLASNFTGALSGAQTATVDAFRDGIWNVPEPAGGVMLMAAALLLVRLR